MKNYLNYETANKYLGKDLVVTVEFLQRNRENKTIKILNIEELPQTEFQSKRHVLTFSEGNKIFKTRVTFAYEWAFTYDGTAYMTIAQ